MLSVVIITKNEEQYIGESIKSVLDISDDIIIVDSGSTDNTLNICRQHPVNIVETNWEGYGQNKNKGISIAKNEWILSLDADECVDNQLKESIRHFNGHKKNIVYQINRKNFFLNKHIRYGVWGEDKQRRLFNKNFVFWNNAVVHEELVLPDNTEIKTLKGSLNHYTVKSQQVYRDKLKKYATLSADKYFNKKKKTSIVQLYCSPLFSFIKNYIVKLGFLDGYYGFIVCKLQAEYTYLKYKYLQAKYSEKQQPICR